ncbi:MAG: hypothetical protein Q9216_003989 [Gyalolechia sp. 2 TL-2023]
MQDAGEDTVHLLKDISSALSKIYKRLEQQEDILQAIRASHEHNRQHHRWPKIHPSDDLILLEAAGIPLPYDEFDDSFRPLRAISRTLTYAEARDPISIDIGRYQYYEGGQYEFTGSDRKLIGQIWEVPYDARVPLTFSRPILGLLSQPVAKNSLDTLARFCKSPVRDDASITIRDFDIFDSTQRPVVYAWRRQDWSSGGAPKARTQDIAAELNFDDLHVSADWRRHM